MGPGEGRGLIYIPAIWAVWLRNLQEKHREIKSLDNLMTPQALVRRSPAWQLVFLVSKFWFSCCSSALFNFYAPPSYNAVNIFVELFILHTRAIPGEALPRTTRNGCCPNFHNPIPSGNYRPSVLIKLARSFSQSSPASHGPYSTGLCPYPTISASVASISCYCHYRFLCSLPGRVGKKNRVEVVRQLGKWLEGGIDCRKYCVPLADRPGSEQSVAHEVLLLGPVSQLEFLNLPLLTLLHSCAPGFPKSYQALRFLKPVSRLMKQFPGTIAVGLKPGVVDQPKVALDVLFQFLVLRKRVMVVRNRA